MPLQYDIFNFNSAFLLQSVYSGFPLHTQTTGKNYYSYPSFYSFNISVRPSAIIYSLQRPFAPQLHTAWFPPFYSTDTSFSRSCTTNKFDSFVCGLVRPFATFLHAFWLIHLIYVLWLICHIRGDQLTISWWKLVEKFAPANIPPFTSGNLEKPDDNERKYV